MTQHATIYAQGVITVSDDVSNVLTKPLKSFNPGVDQLPVNPLASALDPKNAVDVSSLLPTEEESDGMTHAEAEAAAAASAKAAAEQAAAQAAEDEHVEAEDEHVEAEDEHVEAEDEHVGAEDEDEHVEAEDEDEHVEAEENDEEKTA